MLKDQLPTMVDKAETNVSDRKDTQCHQCGRGKLELQTVRRSAEVETRNWPVRGQQRGVDVTRVLSAGGGTPNVDGANFNESTIPTWLRQRIEFVALILSSKLHFQGFQCLFGFGPLSLAPQERCRYGGLMHGEWPGCVGIRDVVHFSVFGCKSFLCKESC